MGECTLAENKKHCNCTYPCSRHGRCCECIRYHQRSGELPACYFDVKTEKTYDRSVENYLRLLKKI